MPQVHNIDIADVVGITARLPDGKEHKTAERVLLEVLNAVRANPQMSLDEVKKYVEKLDSLNAAKPSIDALRNSLTTPQSLMRVCTALGRIWQTQDPTKPQISVASRPDTTIRRSPQEEEAWRTIRNS